MAEVLVPNSSGDLVTVGAASTQHATVMQANVKYMFVSSTLCYIKQGANPTASAASGSSLVPPNYPIYLEGNHGAKLAVIQHTAGGSATLTPMKD